MRIGSYVSVFATAEHELIKDLEQIRKDPWGNSLGLFYRGKCVGSAALRWAGRGDVNSTSVFLKEEFRRKGHGVPLYVHLVMTAKALGARWILSDKRLNKFSRRMWKEKLPKIFPVKVLRHKRKCSRCGGVNRLERFAIDLNRVKRPRLR